MESNGFFWLILIAGLFLPAVAFLTLFAGRFVCKKRADKDELLPGETRQSRLQDKFARLWQGVFFSLSAVWFIAGLVCWHNVEALRIEARPSYLLPFAAKAVVERLVNSGSLFMLAGALAAVSAVWHLYHIVRLRAERFNRLREQAENPEPENQEQADGEQAEPPQAGAQAADEPAPPAAPELPPIYIGPLFGNEIPDPPAGHADPAWAQGG